MAAGRRLLAALLRATVVVALFLAAAPHAASAHEAGHVVAPSRLSARSVHHPDLVRPEACNLAECNPAMFLAPAAQGAGQAGDHDRSLVRARRHGDRWRPLVDPPPPRGLF